MMKIPGKIAPIVKESISPLPDKKIYWGGQDGGLLTFPQSREAINNRISAQVGTPLKDFVTAVRFAVKRIWILDEYFLVSDNKRPNDDRVLEVISWFPINLVASDIRILTKQNLEVDETVLSFFSEAEAAINENSGRRAIRCTIEIREHLTTKFDYVHDRFAIIDDELWHFGATVGGFHRKVNAASRGWSASEHGALEFFEMAWRAGE